MNDDWLWEGSPEDPDDARIVAALRTLDRERPAPKLPARRPRRRWIVALALAAALILALLWPRDRWEVVTISGAAPCARAPCWLAEGETLVTGADEWELRLDVGTVRLGPGTSLRRGEGHRLQVDRGELTVAVRAAPREVQVETPAATVVDLGCAYALAVSGAETRLAVDDGSVALENDAGISVVTAGSSAEVKLGRRPGLPLRDDAPEALVSEVRAFEAGFGEPGPLLAAARPQDLLTLWHVLQLVPAPARAATFDRMLTLAPGLTTDRASVLRLDGAALTALWQALVPIALSEPAVAGPW